MTAKALAYAENDLGVHSVYTAAQMHREVLNKVLSELAESRDKRRDIELKVTDREMVLTSDERSKHPDMPVTRWDKHIKESFRDDDDLRSLREQMFAVVGEIEGLEFDKQIAETDIKIAIARMNELGGYLQYLAIVKASEQPKQPKQPSEGEQST
jgi:sensor domain CHASE-containing protein